MQATQQRTTNGFQASSEVIDNNLYDLNRLWLKRLRESADDIGYQATSVYYGIDMLLLEDICNNDDNALEVITNNKLMLWGIANPEVLTKEPEIDDADTEAPAQMDADSMLRWTWMLALKSAAEQSITQAAHSFSLPHDVTRFVAETSWLNIQLLAQRPIQWRLLIRSATLRGALHDSNNILRMIGERLGNRVSPPDYCYQMETI